jgi:hypothetical protein
MIQQDQQPIHMTRADALSGTLQAKEKGLWS